MLAKSTVEVFRNGRRYRLGEDGFTEPFECTGKMSKYFVPADTTAKKTKGESKDLKRKELMTLLTQAGVKFIATDPTEKLREMYEETVKEVAPASAPVVKDGTGEQDVL